MNASAARIPVTENQLRRWAWGGVQQRGAAARVTRVEAETADAVTIHLQRMDGQPFDFMPGQYLTLELDIEGERQRRAYSLSAPGQGPDFRITVKKVPDGSVSGYLTSRLQVGAGVHVRGPAGSFVLPEDAAQPLVFAAAGSGITPVICLLEAQLARAPATPVSLYYGNRQAGDIIFRRRLTALAAKYPSLHVQYWLSRPGTQWPGGTGRLRADALLQAATPSTRFYLCGPGGFIEELSAGLADAGIAAERIASERFSSLRAARPHSQQPHPVRFARSDHEVMVQPGESILEAGLRAGLDLAFSCTVGGCANCRMMLASGDVTVDEPNCLSESEKAAGQILACCAYPHSRAEVLA